MAKETPVAVVTGASRGAGRGIAVALGSHGCTVYVTGRSERSGDSALPGTIYETAEAVTAAGGKGIAVRVDHSDDAQVKALFDQVRSEAGRLDILVNNACNYSDAILAPLPFWEKPLSTVEMLDVGLRSGYVASWYAAPLLTAQKHGLVIFTSASGSVHYAFGPVYGVQKAGVDKMAADMGVDFAGTGVASLSIWMGLLLTERVKQLMAGDPAKFAAQLVIAESPELTGHVIWALYDDPQVAELSGQTVIGAEMAVRYGIKDVGGNQPPSIRDMRKIAPHVQYPNVIR